MADLTGWDSRHYLELLRQQAVVLRAHPGLAHLRFTPTELAAKTMARAVEPRTKPCHATSERDRLAWFLRIERDVLMEMHKERDGDTDHWPGTATGDTAKVIGQALLDSTTVWDALLNAHEAKAVAAHAPPVLEPFDKYTDFEPISQGGMGEVLKCRDMELGRPVAMKLMHAHLASDPELVRYFNEEAQVASQLQHPNVAPIHERGRTPDGRPYFTMKLIRGQTLAAAIADYHQQPTTDGLHKLLRHFIAVAETLEYAHQKDVLHRDLKPLNIMVGTFGEVQVMDWGMSKVLQGTPHAPSIRTVRTDRPDAETRAGVVRGTFAYMSPEQADPARTALDHRTDLFALGSILCEILTGRPLYLPRADTSDRQDDLWQMARAGHTGPAFDRLDASRGPLALIKLAKQCLAYRPEDRPAHAKDIAREIQAYFDTYAQAERSHEIATATHQERRNTQHWKYALGISLVLVIVMGLTTYLWYDWSVKKKIQAAQQAAMTATQEVIRLREEAKRLPTITPAEAGNAYAAWQKCLTAAEQAELLTQNDFIADDAKTAFALLMEEVRAGTTASREKVRIALRNEKLVADLATAEMLGGQRLVEYRADHESLQTAFAKAFTEYGVDIVGQVPEESVRQLRALHAAGYAPVIRALDYWNLIGVEHKDRPRLVADQLDDHPWRKAFRTALITNNVKELKALGANDQQIRAAIDANEVDLLGAALRERNEVPDSLRVLKAAQEKGFSTYALHMEMGISLATQRNPDYAKAAFYFNGATVINKQSSPAYSNLGLALMNTRANRKETANEAEQAFLKAIELQPDNVVALVNLAMFTLTVRNNPKKADEYLNTALKHRPTFKEATVALALCRVMQFRLKEADALLDDLPTEYRDSLMGLTVQLIRAMATLNEHEAGRIARRLALEHPHHEIGAYCSIVAPLMEGDSVGAEAAADLFLKEFAGEVVIWRALGYTSLALAQMYQGHLKQAEASARDAIRLDPNAAYTQQALFQVLLRQGRFREAETVSATLQRLATGESIMARLDDLRKILFDQGLLKFDQEVNELALGQGKPSANAIPQLAEIALLKGHDKLAYELYRTFVSPKGEDAQWTIALWDKMWSMVQGYEGITHRTNTARAAIRHAIRGKHTMDEQARLRNEALELLRADLDFKMKFTPTLAKIGFVNRLTNIERLHRWLIYLQQCDDFTSVRSEQLAQLPASEQAEWQRFWTDVRKALERSPAPKKEKGP